MSKRIFDGIKVLDFTTWAAGPTCCSTLADHGAQVIKIERPVVGDDTRHLFPLLQDDQSLLYQWYNRGKKSIVLGLNTPEGVEIVRKLVKTADVVVESFRPGVMKKLGLDYAALSEVNPGIVYCSISAFGQTGPYAMKSGYDLLAQALSGIIDMTGEPDGPPIKSGFLVGDFTAALNSFGSIAAALYHREKTGEGQYIDVSLQGGLFMQNSFFEMASVLGLKPARVGQHHATLCPYGIYSGKNGQSVVICGPNEKQWAVLCKLMGREELITDPVVATGPARCKNLPRVIEVLEGWLKGFDDIDDAIALMAAQNLPCTRVKSTADLVNEPQLLAREAIVEIGTPPSITKYDKLRVRGPWVKFSKTPPRTSRASDLGEFNHEIIGGLGYDKAVIDEMQTRWAAAVKNK